MDTSSTKERRGEEKKRKEKKRKERGHRRSSSLPMRRKEKKRGRQIISTTAGDLFSFFFLFLFLSFFIFILGSVPRIIHPPSEPFPFSLFILGSVPRRSTPRSPGTVLFSSPAQFISPSSTLHQPAPFMFSLSYTSLLSPFSFPFPSPPRPRQASKPARYPPATSNSTPLHSTSYGQGNSLFVLGCCSTLFVRSFVHACVGSFAHSSRVPTPHLRQPLSIRRAIIRHLLRIGQFLQYARRHTSAHCLLACVASYPSPPRPPPSSPVRR